MFLSSFYFLLSSIFKLLSLFHKSLTPFQKPLTSIYISLDLVSLYVNEINKASKLIMEAKKPIIYIGGGLINSGPRAIKELKNSAPNKTRKIIPDVIAVLSITSKKDKKLKFLLKAAINPVPAAPIAAPSVGVKNPK